MSRNLSFLCLIVSFLTSAAPVAAQDELACKKDAFTPPFFFEQSSFLPPNPQPIACPVPGLSCNDNWGLDQVDAPAGVPGLDGVFGWPATGKGVHIFFVDSGIDVDHEEFRDSFGSSRIGSGRNFGGTDAAGDTNFGDCLSNSHGTHVAAIAAGLRYGVAKDAILHPVKASLGCTLSSSSTVVNRALGWVRDEIVRLRGQAGGHIPAVVNISVNWQLNGANPALFEQILDLGVPIVNSAGNSNASAADFLPTRLPRVLVVAATDEHGGRWGVSPSLPACFECGSNYGSAVDLFAPGARIVSASNQSPRGACSLTGTSMAAPHVTGAIALFLERHPTASLDQIHAAILGHAHEGVVQGDLGPGTPNRLLSTNVTRPVAKASVACGGGRSCTFTAAECAFDGCSYSWSFGDGGTGSGRTAIHTYAATGEVAVTLTVSAPGLGQSQRATRAFPHRFADVPPGHPFFVAVEDLVAAGVSGGCGGDNFCPDAPVTREQMAVLLLAAAEGPGFAPPACTAAPFLDVPCSSPFAPWIAELVRRGVTAGCGGGNYCPSQAVTREQMAVFLLLAADGAGFTPPACISPPFADVPCSSPFAPWIAELVRRGVTSGCGGGDYCPSHAVTRGQMAVFLVATFDL